MTAFTLEGVKVFIGMPSHRELSPQTNASLIETGVVLLSKGIAYEQRVVYSSSIVTAARTEVARQFMDSDCTHLFWIDSDIVWTPDDFLTILALATKLECVGATYPSKEMPPKFMINVLDKDAEIETNEFGCFEVKGFGLGFTCVQRKVIEQLSEKAPKLVFPRGPDPIPHIFRLDTDNGAFRGEDMAFFADVRDLGYTVNLYPHINLGHVGPHVFRGDFMAALRDIDNASRTASSGSLREQQTPTGPTPEGGAGAGRDSSQGVGRGQEGRQGSDRASVRVLPGRPRPSAKPARSRAAKGPARRADLAPA